MCRCLVYSCSRTSLNNVRCIGGINTQALSREIKWDFNPADYKTGDHLAGGDIFGSVYENSLVDNHKIMLGPRAMGTITFLAEKGSYTVEVSKKYWISQADREFISESQISDLGSDRMTSLNLAKVSTRFD